MDILLAAVKWQHALMYSDNVVIFFETPENHLDYVEFTFQLNNKTGITLKLRK